MIAEVSIANRRKALRQLGSEELTVLAKYSGGGKKPYGKSEGLEVITLLLELDVLYESKDSVGAYRLEPASYAQALAAFLSEVIAKLDEAKAAEPTSTKSKSKIPTTVVGNIQLAVGTTLRIEALVSAHQASGTVEDRHLHDNDSIGAGTVERLKKSGAIDAKKELTPFGRAIAEWFL